ncbi:hypothetical protein IMZ48_47705 [Candidatus Bathyarchaeota archaeon]|nr:hypothetical protein [Candidatus Bathyarchaeota archaeon]
MDGGGKFEIEDTSTTQEWTAIKQWGELFVEGGRKLNQSFSILYDGTQRRGLEEAGFVDIQERDFKVSITTTTSISGEISSLPYKVFLC